MQGITVKFDDGRQINSKPLLLLETVDLSAKHDMLNMTAHNGGNGCITCYKKGYMAAQGKGRSRSYPFTKEPAELRTTATFIKDGEEAKQSNKTVRV